MNYKELVLKYALDGQGRPRGMMTRVQYEEISKELESHCPCNLLVFGVGGDSHLWQNLNINGSTVFLENNPDWISKVLKENNELKIHHIVYKTSVQEYKRIKFDEEEIKIDLPDEVTQVSWDFIIVDAPKGHQPPNPYKGPGRMSSIFSASLLIKEDGIVIVDDFNREVERIYSTHYFGEENLVKVVEEKVAFFRNKKNE